MTITTISLPHRAPRSRMVRWTRPASWAGAGRLVRLEIMHSAVTWMLPLLAVLAWFDAYRAAAGMPPVWNLRESVLTNSLPQDWGALVAGAGAWAGGREGRRRTTDLVAQTVRSAWARRVIALAATAGWVLAAYLAFTGVLSGITAGQATWGGPNWWPVAVGAAALACVCAVGFAIGVFFPGRWIAPLTAIIVFVLSLAGAAQAGFTMLIPQMTRPHSLSLILNPVTGSGDALLSPSAGTPNIGIGVYYHYLPDLAIAQLMLLAGLAVAALGALGLRRAGGVGGIPRRAAAVVAVAGLAAAGAAFGLGSTAYQTDRGVVIPALHDAASDQPIPYTAACAEAAGLPVCVHPALRGILPDLATALGPVLAEVAGLPGAPVRVDPNPALGPTGYSPWLGSVDGLGSAVFISGTPPVLNLAGLPPLAAYGADTAVFNRDIRSLIAVAIAGGSYTSSATPAQQAVALTLLQGAGEQVGAGCHADLCASAPGTPVYLAFKRFAALPAVARRAWLAGHLDALRAGHVTLAEVP